MEEQSITEQLPVAENTTIELSTQGQIQERQMFEPEVDETITYKTTLRHFTFDEIKKFKPETVINFGGVVYLITDMSQSRMILKPIGTRERVTKKTAGV